MSMVFRWSAWGDKRNVARMLPFSIGTFRRAFGTGARYVIGTDEPAELSSMLGDGVEVIPYDAFGHSPFNIDGVATWRKWCPAPRLAPTDTEFYIDADVFLMGDPSELREFDAGHSHFAYLVMQERPGARYWVGRFRPRLLDGLPPVNTGLLGQRPGTDITDELMSELQWWLNHVPVNARQFHDEQGAVSAVLSRRYLLGEVGLLPHDRYRIVNRRTNAHLETLSGITAIHATMDHAAFDRFQDEIARAASPSQALRRHHIL